MALIARWYSKIAETVPAINIRMYRLYRLVKAVTGMPDPEF
jgi:hypothetical protein